MDGRITTGDETPGRGDGRPLRAALFVDFDNLFISFQGLSELAAHRFATHPARWLAWFESGAHALLADDEGEPVPRKILVRRCYLNPEAFSAYRSEYTRAAFTVVDCPPLTQRGKTSADVYMVVDVLDALGHPTRFDEFIILSADADFTPVLLRLRAFDRTTTIIATHFTAAAYRAACDQVVPFARFFEEALGVGAEGLGLPGPETGRGGAYQDLLAQVAASLRERVAASGPLGAREVPGVFTAFPEFRNSNWFGCYSLRALMARLLELEPALVMEGDPNAAWSVYLGDLPAGDDGRPDAPGGDDRLQGLPDDLAAFVRRLADVTGVPALAPATYAGLFQALAETVRTPGLDFNEIARRARDQLEDEGFRVSRAQVGFLLNGYLYNGIEIEGYDARDLAEAWRDCVLTALDNARVELSPGEHDLLDRWIGTSPPAGPAGDPPQPEPALGPGEAP